MTNLLFLKKSIGSLSVLNPKLDFSEQQSDFMQILMKYQLEGRYPDHCPKAPSSEKINEYLYDTKNLYQCFRKML